VNEIVLNPAVAPKYAEDVMRGGESEAERGRRANAPSAWMAPISKLFGGGGGGGGGNTATPTPTQPKLEQPAPLRPKTPGLAVPKLVSKSGPSVGASHATAHVGFSKTGSKAVSSADWEGHAAMPESSTSRSLAMPIPSSHPSSRGSLASTPSSRGALAFFAGAPTARPDKEREWIVLPRDSGSDPARTLRARQKRMSRNLEALNFDAQEDGEPEEPILTRTLRPRGLSDSSIRSTFIAHGEPVPADTVSPLPDRSGVLGALSKRVQSFRHYHPNVNLSGPAVPILTGVGAVPVLASSPRGPGRRRPEQSPSPASSPAMAISPPRRVTVAEELISSRSGRDSDVAARHLKNI